ncbi:MarR family winged helix-turn-helix transcriptional regulator [Frondihabitans cladoniiphilus]|uniref:HTH marR-type domain-containing protein n=1 Tax=Frondihabitans cladoniiphilus TaxID=715785 RepID=A0ABP8VP69_9MICO
MIEKTRIVDTGGIDWGSGGIETQLGWSLHAMYQGFSRAATEAVASLPGGARGYQVLIAATTEEISSQLALAHRLGIDKNAMTIVVDALEQAGLVERRPDPQDRRVRQVLATAEGRNVIHKARAALGTVEDALMRDLSSDEQILLRRLLARVALGVPDLASCLAPTDTPSPTNTPAPREKTP